MNLYLTQSHINWPRPKTYLTLYDEDGSECTVLEDLILRCPHVQQKLLTAQSVLLTFERPLEEDTSLIFPTEDFVEDTIYELYSSGENFQDVNKKFLSEVNSIKKTVRGKLNLFLLGKSIDFDVFNVWRRKLRKSLKGIEIRIYMFNDDCIGIVELCDGLSVWNLKHDQHLRRSVFRKLKYMFVRSHATDCAGGSCKIVSAIGRVIYVEEDESYFKTFTHSRQTIEVRPSNEDRLLCKICLDRQFNVIYLPCKHLAVCEQCHSKLKDNKKCIICRKKVKKVLTNIFL